MLENKIIIKNQSKKILQGKKIAIIIIKRLDLIGKKTQEDEIVKKKKQFQKSSKIKQVVIIRIRIKSDR